MSSLLTNCPRCGARLRGLSTRCDACGADLVPYLTRAGASTRSVPAPSSSATPDVAYTPRASVAPPSDPTLGVATPPGLPFDYTGLRRPEVSETLEEATWVSVLSTMIILLIGVAVGGYFALKSGEIVNIIFGGSVILLIGSAWFPAVRRVLLRDQLLREGRRTLGVIYDRWTYKDSDGDTVYVVAYAFQAYQELVTITRAVKSRSLYFRYEVGDAVPIRYLKSNPHVAMVDAPPHSARL